MVVVYDFFWWFVYFGNLFVLWCVVLFVVFISRICELIIVLFFYDKIEMCG